MLRARIVCGLTTLRFASFQCRVDLPKTFPGEFTVCVQILYKTVMQLFSNIIVAIDLGSMQSDSPVHLSGCAVEQAFRLAAMFGGTVTVFSVLDAPSPVRQAEFCPEPESSGTAVTSCSDELTEIQALADRATKRLQRVVETFTDHDIPAKSVLTFGKPVDEIVQYSAEAKADLLVLASHNDSESSDGRGGLGPTAEQVARWAACPVWCAATSKNDVKDASSDANGEDVCSVLVATDLQEESLESLEMVIAAGQICDLRVSLLHAVELPWWKVGTAESNVTVRDRAETELHEQLAMTDFRTLPFGLVPRVEVGTAHELICQVAEEESTDLVVLGPGCSSFAGSFGETAQRVLRAVRCSVLINKRPSGSNGLTESVSAESAATASPSTETAAEA